MNLQIVGKNGSPNLDVVHSCRAEDLLAALPDGCIDAVITDPPYAATEFDWDTHPDWEQLWREFFRVLEPSGACVITATMRFAADLVTSNRQRFKYDWIWAKDAPTGRLNVKYGPLRQHELVLVFSAADATPNQFRHTKLKYNPQGVRPCGEWVNGERRKTAANTGRGLKTYRQEHQGYPRSILHFPIARPRLHPTQKPIELVEYLVRTYTDPGGVVLDPFCGSGTTGVACVHTGRRFICADSGTDEQTGQPWAEIARRRIALDLGSRPVAADVEGVLPEPEAAADWRGTLFEPLMTFTSEEHP